MSNDVWHIALEPGTTNLQDIIVARIDISDIETISYLLSTNKLKSRTYETNWGGFLMMYARTQLKPCLNFAIVSSIAPRYNNYGSSFTMIM